MKDFLAHYLGMLVERVSGPFALRLAIQPFTAACFGIRAGLADARGGRRPYGWAIVTGVDGHRHLISEGWRQVKLIVYLALVVDVACQLLVYRRVYPLPVAAKRDGRAGRKPRAEEDVK